MNYLSLRIIIHIFLLRPLIKLIFGINVFGKENIQSVRQFIIVANHNSHLDTLLLFYILPVNQILKTHPVAAKEYFSKSKILFDLVSYLFQPVWITRHDQNVKEDFLNKISQRIEQGHNVIIYPEGTRGIPGKIQSFKSGIGRVSEHYQKLPIIPVFISGTEKSLPKEGNIPLPIWNNVFIKPAQLFDASYKDVTHNLQDIINVLSKEEKTLHHKRKLKKSNDIPTVAILGIDGSGKSTLSRSLAKALSQKSNTALVSDTLEFYKNNALFPVQPLISESIRERVNKIAKNASSLKHYKIPKLAELILRDVLLAEIKKWYQPDLVFMDGSPILNLTAWAILYNEKCYNQQTCSKALKILSDHEKALSPSDKIYKDFPELLSLKRLGLTHLHLPQIVFFIDIEPKMAIARIATRNEKKQVHETEEKLAKLRKAYRITCKVIQQEMNIATCILDGDDSINNLIISARKFVKKFYSEDTKNEK